MNSNIIEPTAGLKKMKEEVMEIHERIIKFCETDKELKKIYSGYVIYFSPLYINPSILFFGINPSDRYGMLEEFNPYKEEKTIDNDFKKDLRECFKAINKTEYMDSMVFTNRYFFATKNAQKLKEFFKLANKYFPNYEIQLKQENWTKTIIDELSLKLIILGSSAIDKKFDKIGAKFVEKGYRTKDIKINDIPLISYKRDNRWNRNKMSKKTKQEFIKKFWRNLLMDFDAGILIVLLAIPVILRVHGDIH